MLTISDLHRTEWPRERLLRLGAGVLTVPELLSILVGAATGQDAAIGIGCELLASCSGSLRRMASSPQSALTTVRGIGPVRAGQIVASFELARRWTRSLCPIGPPCITQAISRSCSHRNCRIYRSRSFTSAYSIASAASSARFGSRREHSDGSQSTPANYSDRS